MPGEIRDIETELQGKILVVQFHILCTYKYPIRPGATGVSAVMNEAMRDLGQGQPFILPETIRIGVES